MADTEINKAAAAKKINSLTSGTSAGLDVEKGKKSVPTISNSIPGFETVANYQAFANEAPVKQTLTLGFATAQEYVAFKNAEKKE